MDVDHVDIKTRKDPHRLADGVWNVVQFEIEGKSYDRARVCGALCLGHRHRKAPCLFSRTAFSSLEAVEELGAMCLRRGKVACYDYFFIHFEFSSL